jgi:hypothetical protein
VPFENNIVTLEMTGEEVAAAVRFSEGERARHSREGGSWGGYLQWDQGVMVTRTNPVGVGGTDACVGKGGSEEAMGTAAAAAAGATEGTRQPGNGSVADGETIGVRGCDSDQGGALLTVAMIQGRGFDPRRVYRVATWAGLLDGADDIPIFRNIGRRIATELHTPPSHGQSQYQSWGGNRVVRDGGGRGGGVDSGDGVLPPLPSAHGVVAPPAICSSDGIPFKILVMRHLCRCRWRQLLAATSFAELDTDGDGLVRAAEVVEALMIHTASASVGCRCHDNTPPQPP